MDVTSFSNSWSTSNTPVMTVAGKGAVHGVSAGSSNITGYFTSLHNDPQNRCVQQNRPGTGGGNVGPYKVEPININSQGPVAAGACPNSSYAGFVKYVTNQVQFVNGAAFAYAGLTVADHITIGSRHDLGSGTSTGSATTTGDGSFQDQYSVCSSACPGSSGETDATQSWTVSGVPLPHVNGVIYKCTSITIDGH